MPDHRPDDRPGEPLVPGSLTGFRQFRVGDDGLLPAHVGDRPWTSPVMHAHCPRHRHAPPAQGCSCGLHAWYFPADVRAHALPGLVTAVVRGSGAIVLGEHGFRAERAEIVAVALPGRRTSTRAKRDRVAAVVRRHYPEVRVVDDLRTLERDHPPDDLAALGVVARPTGHTDHRVWSLGWVLGVLALAALLLSPDVSGAFLRAGGWMVLVAGFVAWQGWLLSRTGAPR